MTPWGGGATKAPTKTFDVDDCPPPAFTPDASASVTNPAAGGDTGLTVHIERPDRQKRLEQLTVSLPPGLTGRLHRGARRARSPTRAPPPAPRPRGSAPPRSRSAPGPRRCACPARSS